MAAQVLSMDAAAIKDLNPVWLAQSRLRRRRFDSCVDTCTRLLEANPRDQAVWYLKTRAMTLQHWINDLEVEDEGLGDMLMDENAVASAPRPGTSLARPRTGTAGGEAGGISQAVRPVTNSGRPLTGFARPGTGARQVTSSSGSGRVNTGRRTADLRKALASSGGRNGATQATTQGGRMVRLGTASMLSQGGVFIDIERLDLRRYAQRPGLAHVLCDFILYHDHNPKKALELCSHAVQSTEGKDWWWNARLGKCYYQLGLLRDAEKQFLHVLQDELMVLPTLELARVYLRMDQPLTALEWYQKVSAARPGDISLLLGAARVHDGLNNATEGLNLYKRVLVHDASNVEAIACLASYHFYSDQPEVALTLYRRLLQMGVVNAELWNNLGLCCFYSSQYSMCLRCFEKALALAGDDILGDVWYNIGQVAVGIGDLGLAYQSFKIAVAVDSTHAEALNNLGVLLLRKGSDEQARMHFTLAQESNGEMFEPLYNCALLGYKRGDFQESFDMVTAALRVFPDHSDSAELLKLLQNHFALI